MRPTSIRFFSSLSCRSLSFASSLIRNQTRISPLRKSWVMASVTTPVQGDVPAQVAPVHSGKRPFQGGQKGKPAKMRKKEKKTKVSEGSHEEVLMKDIQNLMAAHKLSDDGAAADTPLPEQGSEIEVDVVELSSTGDGLARQKGSAQIYVVPFSIPGDTVKVKAYRHLKEGYSVADFIEVIKPSPMRDDSRINCKYFAKCSGCQFQMLDYSDQLRIKRDIVVKAYRNFSQLPSDQVPDILETIGSPLQYGYRTKLTPHFDGPPGGWKKNNKATLSEMPPIGFTPKTSRKVLDIEECPIGTEAVNQGLKQERLRMATEYSKYGKGATILLRENTKRVPKSRPSSPVQGILPTPIAVESETYTEYKTCITDNNATSTEYIDNFTFTNPAGAFFQNNNSILSPFTDYIRQHILPPPSLANPDKPIRTLIDAYSGSGLFTITQASLFPGGSVGIDIAEKSIAFARRNAALNGLDEKECRFIAADAPELFKSVSTLDADETVVVLDPPRKGCDESFLKQLLDFAPKRVIYVSCNVHTQARDVGVLVKGEDAVEKALASGGDKKAARYEIESIRGFDFFPQTGHVEGVAVLNRVDL